MIDRVGQQFGNYRLVAMLGQGGYAQVYLGQHVRLPLQAAVEVLHTHLTGSEAERFQREAETIARLAHPSIVRILDFDVQEDVPFLVMDYAPGGSLRRRYPKGDQVPLPLLMAAVKQVAAALQYAHDHKVIHRDLKPENLLVGREQEVVLSDFGLATLAQSTSQLSRSGQGTAGTIVYMAPEQIEGHPRPASDQYALGVVVYEWLCGKPPFEGSMTEVIVQHLSMPPPPLRELLPTITTELEQVVLQALAKDPKLRFASVQDFALAMEEACRTEVPSRHTLLALSSESHADDRHSSAHNLPAPLTPLLGRELDVAAVCTLLRRPEVRLVTLTGTGGVGKTRLALQVATEVLANFPDGAFLVSLAPTSDHALVIPTIAQALDVKESGVRPLLDLLTAYLKDKHLLLCLDNFEQLLPAAPHVTDLLTKCPQLTILVTSRAVLHVQGEHEFPLAPLAVPNLTSLPPADTLPHYAAIALFLQRAQAVLPTFQLSSSNARPVAEICIRLDGLPLAIELAAARLKLLSPQALLARLSQRFSVLTSGAWDAPARQQTLHNTIEWSYQLLDAEEQRLFRRLSVFVGGCTLEAVEAVCAALDGDAAGVVDGLSSLIDKSLLQRTKQENEEPRLVMLETIREYAQEARASSREMEDIQQAHAAYYLRLAEEAKLELVSPQQTVWLERLEREHENLRAALSWLLAQAEEEEGRSSREMALPLSTALWQFWEVRSHYSEGRTFLERVLVVSEGTVTTYRLKVLKVAASMAVYQGDTERGEALCKEILVLSQQLRDRGGVAHALYLRGIIAGWRSDLVTACALLEEALALERELDDKFGIAWVLYFLAIQVGRKGDYTRARALCEESLTLHRALGETTGIAYVLSELAVIHLLSQGDQGVVRGLLEESLALARELGDRRLIATCLSFLGGVSFHQGDMITARSFAEQSLGLSKEIGDPGSLADSLTLLGKVHFMQGDYTAARVLYEESLASSFGVNLWSLEELASVVAAQGELTWAAQLWGVAEALRESMGTPMPPVDRADYERSVAAARGQLGKKAFVAAWEEGRTMSTEQALAGQGRTLVPTTTSISPVAISSAAMESPTSYPAGLTAREVEVLRLVAQGLTNEQVAQQLDISPRTVNTHLTAIYGKIKVTSRSAATRYAIESQLV